MNNICFVDLGFHLERKLIHSCSSIVKQRRNLSDGFKLGNNSLHSASVSSVEGHISSRLLTTAIDLWAFIP